VTRDLVYRRDTIAAWIADGCPDGPPAVEACRTALGDTVLLDLLVWATGTSLSDLDMARRQLSAV
jgi:hypothetical protein